MTSPPSKRPWWKTKRWRITAAATVLILPLAYPASLGPAYYAVGCGWADMRSLDAVYSPLWDAAIAAGLSRRLMDYAGWWFNLGLLHEYGELPPAPY